MSLKGKTLFITGASRGIGLAIALRAARDGANIAIAAKTADAASKTPRHHPYRGGRDRGGGRPGAAACGRRPRGGRRSATPLRADGGAFRRHRHRGQQCERDLAHHCRRHRHAALRPDASDQCARHLHGVEIRHPPSGKGRQSAHPDAVAAARHAGEMVRAAHRLYDGEIRHEPRGAGAVPANCARAASRSMRCGRAPPSPPPRSKTCSAAMPSCAARAAPTFWPTPPTGSSRNPRTALPGNFLIDDTFLAAEGVTDFEPYRVDPSVPLAPDFFVPGAIAAPPGVVVGGPLKLGAGP